MIELRVAVCREIRRKRGEQHLSQKQLAQKLKSSQSRVAKIEVGVGVSLDLMFRALFALGGKLADVVGDDRSARRVRRARS
jgi:predicted transcriptional regulator